MKRPGRFHAERVVFSNGLTAILVENRTLPSVSMNLAVLAGARTDPEEFAGTAVMASRLLDEGTTHRTSLEIADAIESVGGSIDCDGSHDRTTVHLSVLGKDVDLGLDLVSDIVRNAVFSPERIEHERQRLLSEIRSAQDRPQVVAGWEFNELVYRGHPLHRPAHGYPDSIRRIRRANIEAFHADCFVPGKTVVSVVGDFEHDEMRRRLEAALGPWPAGGTAAVQAPPLSRQRDVRRRFLPVSSEQAHVYFGHLGIRRRDPDFYALQVLDTILGAGAGLTARIPRVLRDEQGLAYSTFASITGSAGVEPGKFIAYIGTSPENVPRAVAGFVDEVERIIDEPVTDSELADAQAYLTGSFVFGFESNAQIARFLINAEVFGLGFDYVDTYPRRIEAVTRDAVRRAAAAHLTTRAYSLVVAGPEGAVDIDAL